MKRIDLIKYGFIRDKEEDFSDDGNRFTCYRVGRVRISKLVSNGSLYLSGRIDSNKLIYDEYSALPHYKDMDTLNGVLLDCVNEEDLKKFYEDCIAYDAEYAKAEDESVMPTYEELLAICEKVKEVRVREYMSITSRVTLPMICSLSKYTITMFADYFNTLKHSALADPAKVARSYAGTSQSKYMVRPEYLTRELAPDFYYTQLLDLIKEMK